MDNFVSIADFQNAVKNKQPLQEVKEQTQAPKVSITDPIVDKVEINTSTNAIEKSSKKETKATVATPTGSLEKQLQSAKNQNGLIEKAADKIKGMTGLGLSSKKLEQMLNDVKAGKVDEQTFLKNIEKYRTVQENTAQTAGDVASILAAGTVFFGIVNTLIKGKGIVKLNRTEAIEEIKKYVDKVKPENLPQKLKWMADTDKINAELDKLSKKGKGKGIAAIAAGLTGGVVKNTLLKVDRIGTKQYKPEVDSDTMTKQEIRKARKEAKKEKKNANLRNFVSGGINGLMMPITTIAGGLGVIPYLGANAVNRYVIGTKEDSGNKSVASFVQNVKDSPATYIAGAALAGIPLAKKARFSAVLDKNLDKTIEKLQKANLQTPEKTATVYEELETIILGDSKISQIMNDPNLSNADKIRQLSDTNIFALKFKQIRGSEDSLAKALKEECPETWTIDAAQAKIDSVFGAGKYKNLKTVGTGTIAQTFEAEAQDGSKVCIKMVHDKITPEKIEADRKAFEDLINASSKTAEEKKFLINNLNNLAKGVAEEAKLENEMAAAKKLAEVTKQARVVKPITVQDGIYVMEKADGISLATLNKFQGYKNLIGNKSKDELQKSMEQAKKWYDADVQLYKNDPDFDKKIKWVKQYYEEYREAFDNYDKYQEMKKTIDSLTDKEAVTMLERYQDILIEQFSQVDAKGKTIHGDIHPGNIFIDIKKLKAGQKDFFTLIDTGNTIEQNADQAIRFMNLTSYIKNADYENIASFVARGATGPDGMSEEKIKELIEKELKETFFGDKVSLGMVNNDTVLQLTDTIMKKHNIIPSSTQGNLMKAKRSADNSLMELMGLYFNKKGEQLEGVENMKDAMATLGSIATEQAGLMAKKSFKTKAQERANLTKLPLGERAKIRRGPNAPKLNSEEYLTYQFKQYKLSDLLHKAKEGIDKADSL